MDCSEVNSQEELSEKFGSKTLEKMGKVAVYFEIRTKNDVGCIAVSGRQYTHSRIS